MLLGNKSPTDLLNSFKHQIITAPLFSREAYELCATDNNCQYGVLGTVLEIWWVYIIPPLSTI